VSGQYPRRPGVGKVSKSLLSTKYNIKIVNLQKSSLKSSNEKHVVARAAVVYLNFRARLNFPVPVCTVPSSMDRTSRSNKVDAFRYYASYRLNSFY